MSATIAILLNPHANGGNGARRWVEFLKTPTAQVLDLRNAVVFDGLNQPLSSLSNWISECIQNGVRNFVAAGGDGTVHLLLNTLLNQPNFENLKNEIKLGAVALGSSNDFHKRKGTEILPLNARVDFGVSQLCDIGFVEFEKRKIYFIINSSIGVTAQANAVFNLSKMGLIAFLKKRWVNGAIILTALKTFLIYKNQTLKISVDNFEARNVSVTNIGVVKNVHFSGNMRYDLQGQVDDGYLGFYLCDSMNRLEMICTLRALADGKFSGRPKTSSQFVRALQVESVNADRKFSVETDGEVFLASKVRFGLVSRGVLVCP